MKKVLLVLFCASCFGLGAIFGDFWLGPLTLIVGTLSAYYMSIGKWRNYIFGMLFNALYAYTCLLSGLFGYAIFALVVYLPMNIWGLVSWRKNNRCEVVRMKSMRFRSGLALVFVLISSSLLIGWLLTFIPSQNLAFLDSSSQAINLAGLILLALRFREGWYVYLANNTIDLAIWVVNTVDGTQSSQMMLIVSVMYLVMNIYAIFKWIKTEKIQNLVDLGEKDC